MEKIGKYEVLEKVGSGGFGIVYKGRDPFIKRFVAIKTCSSEDEDIRNRFFREAEIAGNLHHRNVTTVYDFGFQDGVPYLVQEFLPGDDLDQLLKRHAVSPAQKLEYLIQIAAGLQYAHDQGVIHRDIKPSNVRVIAGDRVKIMDFGIAKLANLQSQLTKTGMTLGTAFYLAPEQIRGDEVTVGVDIFSFGVLAYEMFAHRRPFDGENMSHLFYQILSVDPPPLRQLDPACPEELAAIIERCLRKDPRERWSSCAELGAALERLRGTLSDDPDDPREAARSASGTAAEPGAEVSETVALSASQAKREIATVAARIDELLAAGDATAAEIEITLARKRFAGVAAAPKLLDPLGRRIAEFRERVESARRKHEKVQALVARGHDLAAAGELDEARLVAHTAVELDPEDAGARQLEVRIDQVEAELRARAEEERRRREEEERRRREEEAERQRQAEEAEKRRLAAEAERQRRAEEEERRRREAEAERQRQAEERRVREEAERKRRAEEEERRRQAEAAEQQRRAEEEERRRREAEADRQRKAEEAERRRRERAAAEQERRAAAERERERKAAAEEQRRTRADEEKRRWAEAQEAARERDQEQRRQKAADKQVRRRAEAAAKVATLLSAGKVEQAQKTLATTVQRLGEDPAFATLARKVAAAQVPEREETPRKGGAGKLVGIGLAAAVVVAGAIAVGVWRTGTSTTGSNPAPQPAPETSPAVPAPTASAPAQETSTATAPPSPSPEATNEPVASAAPQPAATPPQTATEVRTEQQPAAQANLPVHEERPAPTRTTPEETPRESAATRPAQSVAPPPAAPVPAAQRNVPIEVAPPPATASREPAPANPQPSSSTARPVAESPPPAAAAPPADDRASVLAALDRYRRAFEALDAAAVQAVWPAVNSDALHRSFEQDESLQMALSGCEVEIDGGRATAVCQLEQRIRPRAGEPQHLQRRTRFELRRSGNVWTIAKIQ